MSAGAAGAAAAAKMARLRREEEESMTGYTNTELADGWEFKILRSATAAFRNPERMRQAIEEESRSGWALVEKFDDQRLRFKRPAPARGAAPQIPASGTTPGIDPYRTTFGMSNGKMAAMIVGSILGTLAVAALVVFLAKRP